MDGISAYQTILLERKKDVCSLLDTLAEMSKLSNQVPSSLNDESRVSGSTGWLLNPASWESTVELRGDLEQQLGDIEEALARIENGTFGYCHACGECLGDFQLRVFPEARSCFKCQLKLE